MNRTRLLSLLPPLLYTLVAFVYTWPLLPSFGNAIIGGGIDGWNNYWNYWWTRHALLDGRLPFDTDYIFYNTGVSLRFHTLQPLNGWLSAPLQAFGLAFAQNALVILSYTLCGWGLYLVTRYVLKLIFPPEQGVINHAPTITDNPQSSILNPQFLAAFIAGFAYAFANPWRTQYLYGGQVNRLTFEWIPFFVYFALRLYYEGGSWREWRTWRLILLTALFVLANALTELQLLVYIALFVAVWLLIELFAQGWRSWLPAAGRVVVAGGLAGLVLSPLLYQMLSELANNSQLAPGQAATLAHSADLLELFMPNRSNLLWGWATGGFDFAPYDKYLVRGAFSPSYIIYALAIYGAIRLWRSPVVKMLVVNLLLFVSISLGPRLILAGNITDVPLPYAALYLLPFMRVSRDPERFGEMAMLFWCALAGVGMMELLLRFARRGDGRTSPAPTIALTAVLALLIVEFVAVRPPLTPVDTPPFYQQIGREGGGYAILELPIYKSSDEDKWMSYQAAHQKPILGGDLARKLPHPFAEYTPVLRAFWLQRQPDDDIVPAPPLAEATFPVLNWANIRYAVVIKDQLDRLAQTGREQRMVDGAWGAGATPHYEDDRMRVYSVPLTTTGYVTPLLAVGPGWYASEQQPDGWHRWLDGGNGSRASVTVLNLDPTNQPVAAKLTFRSFSYNGPHELEVYQRNDNRRARLATIVVNELKAQQLDLTLPYGQTELEFYCAAPATAPSGDERLLNVGVGELRVNRLNQNCRGWTCDAQPGPSQRSRAMDEPRGITLNAEQVERISQTIALLKAIADPQRLAILGLLASQPGRRFSYEEIGSYLRDSKPLDISAAVEHLQQAGLIKSDSQPDGDTFSLAPSYKASVTQAVATLSKLHKQASPAPTAPLPAPDERTVIVSRYLRSGKLLDWPPQIKRQEFIATALAEMFERGREYTEREVTDILREIYDHDPIVLRRALVDFGHLERTNNGSVYWRK